MTLAGRTDRRDRLRRRRDGVALDVRFHSDSDSDRGVVHHRCQRRCSVGNAVQNRRALRSHGLRTTARNARPVFNRFHRQHAQSERDDFFLPRPTGVPDALGTLDFQQQILLVRCQTAIAHGVQPSGRLAFDQPDAMETHLKVPLKSEYKQLLHALSSQVLAEFIVSHRLFSMTSTRQARHCNNDCGLSRHSYDAQKQRSS